MLCALDLSFQSTDMLNEQTLLQLAMNEVHAIRVKNFYPRNLCEEISNRMLASHLYGSYENAPLIGRVGQALYESRASNESQRRYWDNAQNWVHELRSSCAPYLTPIDKLRLELDEVWPHGATLGIIDHKRMFVGLARVFKEGSGAEPHQDILAWDMPESLEARCLLGQIAGNIYLKMPPSGGEITLWSQELSQAEYACLQTSGSYGIDPSKLPPPLVTLTPEPGELILFNSRRMHAVTNSRGGQRVTWSCFIGLKLNEKPLIMWS